MKRFFSILATVAVATMTLVGCDKDNDKDAVKWEENGNTLTAVWTGTNDYNKTYDCVFTALFENDTCTSATAVFTFKTTDDAKQQYDAIAADDPEKLQYYTHADNLLTLDMTLTYRGLTKEEVKVFINNAVDDLDDDLNRLDNEDNDDNDNDNDDNDDDDNVPDIEEPDLDL